MMVMKSLDILNKLYSSQSDMFRLALEAQVSEASTSVRIKYWNTIFDTSLFFISKSDVSELS